MREGGGGNSCMKSINYSCCAPLLACAFSLSDFCYIYWVLHVVTSYLTVLHFLCLFVIGFFFCFFSDCHLLIPRSCLPLLMVN